MRTWAKLPILAAATCALAGCGGDGGTAAFERPTDLAFAVVQRLQPSFGFGNPVLGFAQPRGAVDKGLIEFLAILADGVDPSLELVLNLSGLLLLLPDCVEFLLALAKRVERRLFLRRKNFGDQRETKAEAKRGGQRARRIVEP